MSISRRIAGSMPFNLPISAGVRNNKNSGASIPAAMSLLIVTPDRSRSRKRRFALAL
jgi:hypothetical protein